jgi:hypothetical protein
MTGQIPSRFFMMFLSAWQKVLSGAKKVRRRLKPAGFQVYTSFIENLDAAGFTEGRTFFTPQAFL